MQQYSIEEMRECFQDVLDSATSEPVILVNQSRPSYVVLSVQNYRQLIARLTELEDRALGEQAETALQNSALIGTETLITEFQQLANVDDLNQ